MRPMNLNKLAILGLVLAFTVGFFCVGPAFAQKDTTITFWNIANEGERAVFEQAIKRFEEDNPNVNVKMTSFQNDPYKDKIKVAAGADNLPDAWYYWGGGVFKSYVDAGKVENITGEMNETGFIEKFPPSTFDLITYDGKIYGVPYGELAGVVMWYNKDLFEKYDIDIPQTWTELEEVAKKLKSNGVIPFALANKSAWPGTEWYESLVLRLAGKEKIIKTLNNEPGHSMTDEPFVKAGEMVQDFIEKGYFNEGYASLSYDRGGARRLLYTGRAAIEVMGSWEYNTAVSENPKWARNSMAFFPFPKVEDGEGDPTSMVGAASGSYLVISSGIKEQKKEAIFELYQYLADNKTIQARADRGVIIPIKGVEDRYEDPMQSKLNKVFTQAKNIIQFWDQKLPPELAEEHKSLCSSMLNLDITPEEYTQRMEEAIEEYYE